MTIEELTKELKCTLDEMDVDWEHIGVETNMESYEKNKSHLVDVLRKSPHWNEDLHGLLFDCEEMRTLNTYKTEGLFRRLLRMLPREHEDRLCYNVRYYSIYSNQFVSEGVAEILNSLYPDLRAQEGQKTSRMINKLWKMLGVDINSKEYQVVFAEFADAINPISITRPFILSANPSDYITMSYGSSWASCHIINPYKANGGGGYSGCYKAGTLSYMNDAYTLIGYTLEKLPENLRDACRIPKITRQCFMVDVDNGVIMQSRQYPETNNTQRADEYRKLVQEGVAEALGEPNLWKKTSGYEPFYQYDNRHYPDYHYVDSYNINLSFLKTRPSLEDTGVMFPVGQKPYCLRCGGDIDDSEYIYCEDCNHDGKVWCECCEEWCDEDDGCETADGWRCNGCIEEYYEECAECGRYVHRNDVWEVENDSYTYVCYDCVNYSSRYVRCERCDCLYDTYHENMTYTEDEGLPVCEYCAEHYCYTCTDCGKVFWYADSLTEEGLCEECAGQTEEEAA